jgi:hypothetical protein
MHRLLPLFVMAFLLAANTHYALAQSLLTVQRITAFQMLQGLPQWSASVQQRLSRTSFVLQPNGVIIIRAPGRSDLYPLSGNFQQEGPQIRFYAVRQSRIGGTGVAHVVWNGVINLQDRLAQIEVSSGTGNAAVINNQKFQGSNSERYAATLQLR